MNYDDPFRFETDSVAHRLLEEWAGHRTPRNLPMVFARWLLLIAFAALIALALSCCTTTTTTAPDGTVTVTKAPAPGVLPFAGAAIRAYSPRPIIVREEKSGPITAEEISSRWQPLKDTGLDTRALGNQSSR